MSPPALDSTGSAKRVATSHRGEGGVFSMDWISRLPCGILSHILSLLEMKEAGRTSILSRRWRYTWTSISNLKFTSSNTSTSMEAETSIYVNWVNAVTRLHQGLSLDHFILEHRLDESCTGDINCWITFAFKSKVQRLKLCLPFPGKKHYSFPQPRDLPCCKSLLSLELSDINVSGNVLKYFLSNCPFLERLTVCASDTLFSLNVHGRSLKLKFLAVHFCANIKHLKVFAPELLSFHYFGHKLTLQLKYAPKLSDFSIGGWYCSYLAHGLLELSSYLSQLQTLTLGTSSIKIGVDDCIPVFTNLQHLKFIASPYGSGNLFVLASLIRASPALYKLTFQQSYSLSRVFPTRRERSIVCGGGSPHQNLKVAEFVGFTGHGVDDTIALYVIKSAGGLEKITFDTREVNMDGSLVDFVKKGRGETVFEQLAWERAKQVATERAKKLGEGIAHAEVEIII